MTQTSPSPSSLSLDRAASVDRHGGRSATSVDAAFYRGLFEMTKERIERAFSGEHGDEREEPDAWHRMEDAR